MNLSHAIVVDSEAAFEIADYDESFEINFKPEMLEQLALVMPDLVLPFLNDYYSFRDVSLFTMDVAANEAILQSVSLITWQVANKEGEPSLLDKTAETLLRQIFL